MNSKKIILYIIIGIFVLLLIMSSFDMVRLDKLFGRNNNNKDYSNIPEECRKPEGQTLEAWKEHLGHHADTQECLKYFT